ncbi:hypothetical protein NQ317_002110 [Molorchus minor]|uniref:Uncharacterized protein n=1 Tax=Molorchus minor TaxID=1323400 RepID=A0ABQ9JWH4_9CUCU|nr:hypothetical protein NQ317_002110 [Molorchus minor]
MEKIKGQELSSISNSENHTVPNVFNESNTTPIQNNTSEDEPDETSFPAGDVLTPEIVLDSASGVDIPDDSKYKDKHFYRPVLQWWRPVQEKWDRVKDILAYTKHPNYGGVQLLSPRDIWERLHEAGLHYLTGINGAVFGIAGVENHDYPFAYRRLSSPKRLERQARPIV